MGISAAVIAVSSVASAGMSYKQSKDAKKAAAATAAKQQAEVDKQDALIEARRKEQGAVTAERKARTSQNQLLSGADTGAATAGSANLLGDV